MWKPIVGFEDLYDVSDEGEVYSHITGKILKHAVKKSGYHNVTLVKDNKLHYMRVHILVASAFIPNPENKPQVNHVDGDKSNNRADNLEWCTAKENTHHCIHVLGKRTVPVAQYTKGGVLVKIWNSILEASQGTGAKAQHIWRNANGIRNSTHGYIFKYAKENL